HSAKEPTLHGHRRPDQRESAERLLLHQPAHPKEKLAPPRTPPRTACSPDVTSFAPTKPKNTRNSKPQLWEETRPETTLERTLAAEIMSATWRFRRCGAMEASLDGHGGEYGPDPMEGGPKLYIQNTVDRARGQAQRSL